MLSILPAAFSGEAPQRLETQRRHVVVFTNMLMASSWHERKCSRSVLVRSACICHNIGVICKHAYKGMRLPGLCYSSCYSSQCAAASHPVTEQFIVHHYPELVVTIDEFGCRFLHGQYVDILELQTQ